MAVMSDDMAYTSPSTALNQNESVNVKARAPMADAANTANLLLSEALSPSFIQIF